MFVAHGNIRIANSTLFANTANGAPGGSGRFLPLGPGGDAAGGGLYLSNGNVSLTGVTTASNQALVGIQSSGQPGSSSGGGIANHGAGLFINTTLIGNNTQGINNVVPPPPPSPSDVFGAVTTAHSLIGEEAGAVITDNGGNIFNVNPALDPGGLKLNGGPTQTVALEDGSPAIDTGDNPVCSAPVPNGLGGIDQRGRARFRHGDNLCDIGAFEFITLFIQPTSLSFGSQPVGHQTRSQAVSVTNNQTTNVTLNKSIGGADPADFRVSTTCGSSLASHATCSVLIAFRPRATGTRTAVLTVSDSPDRTTPYQVTLSGVGR
jgi:hypothetical protein